MNFVPKKIVYLIFGILVNTLFLNTLIRLPVIAQIYKYLNINDKRAQYELIDSADEDQDAEISAKDISCNIRSASSLLGPTQTAAEIVVNDVTDHISTISNGLKSKAT